MARAKKTANLIPCLLKNAFQSHFLFSFLSSFYSLLLFLSSLLLFGSLGFNLASSYTFSSSLTA